jgi:hypothetical protein
MTELPLDGNACTPQDGLFGGELQGSRGSPARIVGGESVKFLGHAVGFFGERLLGDDHGRDILSGTEWRK